MAQLTDNVYTEIARTMLGMVAGNQNKDKTFRSFFGAPIPIINLIWTRIVLKAPLRANAHPKHLLWALVFLKCYNSETVLRRICGWPSENVYREWSFKPLFRGSRFSGGYRAWRNA